MRDVKAQKRIKRTKQPNLGEERESSLNTGEKTSNGLATRSEPNLARSKQACTSALVQHIYLHPYHSTISSQSVLTTNLSKMPRDR